MFKTPKFWLKTNWISILLIPLSLIYRLGFFFKKIITKTYQPKIPIICVGNIIAGGSGKTPVAIALGKYFKKNGINFCYLTRGYKGKNRTVKYIDNIKKLSANEVGDEALLLSEIGAVFVSSNRWLGYKQIEKNPNIKAIIMDDGLQNFELEKDIKILVIDTKIVFGNNLLLPCGPMRQKFESVVDEIDLFVLIGKKNLELTNKILSHKPQAQIINTQTVIKNLELYKNKNLIAFCGIAYPEKFFDLLNDNGFNLIESHSYADHYSYSEYQIEKLIQRAKNKNCYLITTKKDWVKFPFHIQKLINYADIDIEIENSELSKKILKNIFGKWF